MKRRVAVRAIIASDGKMLGVKLKPYETALTGNFWCTIGGGINEGEALLPALRREIIEETATEPVIGNLLYVMQFKSGDVEHLEFFFHVTNAQDFKHVDVTKTTHGGEEIAEIGFINPSIETVLPEFLTTIDFTEIADKPTQFYSYL
jgi:8-oxo-dGTP pyrophosphatase MutT (NUDIX family)